MMSPCHLPHCWENAWRGVGAGRDIMRSCVRTVAKPVHPRSPFFPPQHQPSAGVFVGESTHLCCLPHGTAWAAVLKVMQDQGISTYKHTEPRELAHSQNTHSSLSIKGGSLVPGIKCLRVNIPANGRYVRGEKCCRDDVHSSLQHL